MGAALTPVVAAERDRLLAPVLVVTDVADEPAHPLQPGLRTAVVDPSLDEHALRVFHVGLQMNRGVSGSLGARWEGGRH